MKPMCIAYISIYQHIQWCVFCLTSGNLDILLCLVFLKVTWDFVSRCKKPHYDVSHHESCDPSTGRQGTESQTWTWGLARLGADFTPKMDGENNGNPDFLMDDLGIALFLETPKWFKNKSKLPKLDHYKSRSFVRYPSCATCWLFGKLIFRLAGRLPLLTVQFFSARQRLMIDIFPTSLGTGYSSANDAYYRSHLNGPQVLTKAWSTWKV